MRAGRQGQTVAHPQRCLHWGAWWWLRLQLQNFAEPCRRMHRHNTNPTVPTGTHRVVREQLAQVGNGARLAALVPGELPQVKAHQPGGHACRGGRCRAGAAAGCAGVAAANYGCSSKQAAAGRADESGLLSLGSPSSRSGPPTAEEVPYDQAYPSRYPGLPVSSSTCSSKQRGQGTQRVAREGLPAQRCAGNLLAGALWLRGSTARLAASIHAQEQQPVVHSL